MQYIEYLIIFCVWAFYVMCVGEYFLHKKPKKLLMASMFLMPFYSVSLNIGVQLAFYKIIIIPFFCVWISRKFKFKAISLLLILYMGMISFLSYIHVSSNELFEIATEMGRAPIKARAEVLVQLVFNILTFAPIAVMTRIGLSKEDALNALRGYVYGCVVIVGIGLIQQIFYYTSIPWFDYWFLGTKTEAPDGDMLNLSRNFVIGSVQLYRMSSLSGEPKHLAAFILLGIILTSYLRDQGRLRHSGKILLLLLTAIVMSHSTSGVLTLCIIGGLYLLKESLKGKKVVWAVAGLAMTVGTIIFFSEIITVLFWKVSSIEMMRYAAPKDAFGVDAILRDYTHLTFGYGPGLLDVQAPELYLYQETPFGIHNREADNAYETLNQPSSFLLQIITSYGMIGGLLVFVFLCSHMTDLRGGVGELAIMLFCTWFILASLAAVASIMIFSVVLAFHKAIHMESRSMQFLPKRG